MSTTPDERDEEIVRLRLRTQELVEANEALERDLAERRRAEDELRERELEARLIMENIPNLVSLLKANGEPELINRRILDYTGQTEEALKSWRASDLVHPDDLAHASEAARIGIGSGEPHTIVYRMRRHDGVYRWFDALHAPLRDENGRLIRWCVTVRDIDDLKRAEEVLQERERSLRSVIDGIPGFIAITSPDGDLLVANRQMTDYFGAPVEELKSWGAYVHEADLPHVFEKFRTSMASATPFDVEHRLLRADGAYRWFSSRGLPIRDAAGSVANWYFLLTDIDDLKRMQEVLQESERSARLIVDTIPGGVCVLTRKGEIDRVNEHMLRYFQRTEEELKLGGTADVIHPDDYQRVVDTFIQSTKRGEAYDAEQRLRGADGAYRWFQVRGLPFRDGKGRIVRWYVLHTDIDERKRAEEALRARERELRLVVDSIPGMITVFRPDGELELVNRPILEFFGKTLDELKAWQISDTVHPEDRSYVLERFAAAIASGSPLISENRSRRFDGEFRWLQTRLFPLKDENGAVVRWYNLLLDVDERKRAEDALAASEENLKLTIDTIPALAWSARTDGTAEFFSQHYLDYVGLSAEQAEGWGWTAALHPDDAGELAASWQAILASAAPGEAEARLRRFDGQYRWFLFRANPLRDGNGDIVKWYGVNTDIEDRKQAESALKEAYEFLTEAQRLSRTGSFSADIANDEHIWSDELYRVFEFEPESRISVQRVRAAIHPDDLPEFDAGFERSLTQGVDFDHVFRVTTASGTLKHLHASGHLWQRLHGRPVFLGAIQDVTERAMSEQALNSVRSELAHAARAMSLGALAASIAHEVNQPLSGIVTNANTCLRMLSADPPNVAGALETTRRALRDGSRASDVVSRLRALFGRKELAVEAVDLNDAAREVVALSWHELQRRRIAVHGEYDEALPGVVGDRVQLQQVVLNLILNASDAMEAVDDRPRQLLIRTALEAGEARLTVQDSGVGLSPDSRDKLFEAFYTTKPNGMGIGLSVSRSIIERHRGRLWASQNDGPGAAFSFAIPLRATEAEPAYAAAAVGVDAALK